MRYEVAACERTRCRGSPSKQEWFRRHRVDGYGELEFELEGCLTIQSPVPVSEDEGSDEKYAIDSEHKSELSTRAEVEG